MRITEYVERFKFNNQANGISEFIFEVRDRVYRRFFLIHEEMRNSGIKEGRLVVYTTIEGKTSSKTFYLAVDETSLLADEIFKYFEENEEYEKCAKILEWCSGNKQL